MGRDVFKKSEPIFVLQRCSQFDLSKIPAGWQKKMKFAEGHTQISLFYGSLDDHSSLSIRNVRQCLSGDSFREQSFA